MQTCATCAAPLRESARFCTRCGTAVAVVIPDAVPERATSEPLPEPLPAPLPEPLPDDSSEPVPARIPLRGRVTPPPARSTAATWALVTGITPIVVSVVGNLLAAQLGAAAVGQVEGGDPQGAWAPVLVVLALVFVGNAALLTVCAMTGARGIRETANGVTRGRALAVAGLAAGGVNLVLWVSGLVITVGGLNAVMV